MTPGLRLETLLNDDAQDPAARLAVFALLSLGVVESLVNGSIGATDAVRMFFHADNCLYVRTVLKDKGADRVMSHGVQLPDLVDCLPVEQAQRQFAHELATMRSLCIKLLERKSLVA